VRSLRGAWMTAPKEGDARTYPSPEPDREIDFVMWTMNGGLSGVGSVRVIEHVVIDEPMASDHRPLLAVLEFRR